MQAYFEETHTTYDLKYLKNLYPCNGRHQLFKICINQQEAGFIDLIQDDLPFDPFHYAFCQTFYLLPEYRTYAGLVGRKYLKLCKQKGATSIHIITERNQEQWWSRHKFRFTEGYVMERTL